MFFLIPWRVDVPWDRWPVMNWLIIVVTVAVFCLQVFDVLQAMEDGSVPAHQDSGSEANTVLPGITGALTLTGWGLKGLFGHMWLHAGPLHLAGNMLFLWIFGNALCAKVGNLKYLLLYVLFGVSGGVIHLLFDSDPVLGASGAINGVVGMYLVLFFENEITCLFAAWLIVPYVRWFEVSSIWMILFWLFWDVVGAIGGGSHVAHFAHLGGFGAGFGIALLLCYKGWITMEEYEKSLWQAWQEWRHDRKDLYEKYGSPPPLLTQEMKEEAPAPVPAVTTPLPPPKPIPMIDPDTGKVERDLTGDGLVIVGCACGKCIRATRQYAGKIVRCPHCKAKVQVPDVPVPKSGNLEIRSSKSGPYSYIRLRCRCGKGIKVPARFAGGSGKCPRCGARIKVPPTPDNAAGRCA